MKNNSTDDQVTHVQVKNPPKVLIIFLKQTPLWVCVCACVCAHACAPLCVYFIPLSKMVAKLLLQEPMFFLNHSMPGHVIFCPAKFDVHRYTNTGVTEH